MKTILIAVLAVIVLAGCVGDRTVNLRGDVIINSGNVGTVITATDYDEAERTELQAPIEDSNE